MSTRSVEMTQPAFANDSWHTQRNARTLRAFMALKQAEIGERLVQLRRQRGNPPQEVVAQEIGVSYRSLQSWEAGDAKPSWRNLTKIAEFYGVSEEYILMGDVDPTAPRNLTQLDRIEAKLDRVLAHLSEEAVNASLAGLRGQLAKVTSEVEALRLDQAAAGEEARQRFEAMTTALDRLQSRRPA